MQARERERETSPLKSGFLIFTWIVGSLATAHKSYLPVSRYDLRARAGYGPRYYRAVTLPGNTSQDGAQAQP